MLLTQIARRFRERGQFDSAYDVPFTTVHTGVIRGGTALNIVPRDCVFDFEFRHLPFDDPEELLTEVKRFAATLLPEMHAVDPQTYIEFDALSTLPGFDTHGGNEIAELGRSCSATHEYGKVSFGTEASLFHNAGIAAIICGPGHIEQAHQPNEWVALDAACAVRSVHATPRRSNLRQWTVSETVRDTSSARPRPIRRSRSPFPDLAPYAAGNDAHTVCVDVRRRATGTACPRSGADSRQRGLRRNRPRLASSRTDPAYARHFLTLVFANVGAYLRFDRADPFESRCVDEDFNRLWTREVLDGPRRSAELARARELRPIVDRTDHLLDLHFDVGALPSARDGWPTAKRRRARQGDRQCRSTS